LDNPNQKKSKENIAEEEKNGGLFDTADQEKSQENIVSHDSNQEEIGPTQTQNQEESNVTNCHLEKEHQVSRESSFSKSIPGKFSFLPLFDPKFSLVFHK
jgi:hypothetical protein